MVGSQCSHKVDFIFHIGARTDTAEFDMAVFNKFNTSATPGKSGRRAPGTISRWFMPLLLPPMA
ncbi:MAG: hypothetical protein U5L09_22805 [Bacteroidales bacterium]|nr:hypothetical protein [Bacteroidales bacterium]